MRRAVPTRRVPVRLSLGAETPTQAMATVSDWTLLERLRRGAVGLALCWSLAGVSVIIPGLHFVLPPVLLLLGPVVFVVRVLVRASFVTVDGPCPRCKEPRSLSLGSRVQEETNVFCDGCGNQLTLTLEPAAPPGG